MSSLSNSYNKPDQLSQITLLTDEEQNHYIDKASSNEIISIFARTFKESSSNNTYQMGYIRELALEKLQKLRNDKSLNADQVKDIVNICKTALPLAEKSGDIYIERGILHLLTTEIDDQNVCEMTRFALEQKSKPILDKCLKVIETMTGIRPECEDFGSLNFKYAQENTEAEFSILNDFLIHLKNSLGTDTIKVSIHADLDNQVGYQELLSFLKEHSEMIHSLELTNFRGTEVNEQLNTLLTHCSQLTTLGLSKCEMDRSGLTNLHLLHNLENLTFRSCPFTDPPDLSSLTNLKQLSFNACTRLKNLPVLNDLSKLESLTLSMIPIENPPNLAGLTNLKFLNISMCTFLKSFPDPKQTPMLEVLKFDNCFTITNDEKKMTFSRFLEANPERALENIWSFDINDTKCLEPKIKDADLKFYFENIDKFKPPNQEFRKTLIDDLIKNQPQQAIEYAWNLGKGGPISVSDKQAFSNAIETYCLQEEPNKALRLAIDNDDVALAEKAIRAQALVQGGSIWGIPLLRACKYGSAGMVKLLLENNADPKILTGTHDHQTPLSEAKLRTEAMRDCLDLLKEKDDGFTDEVMALKLLAHKFSAAITYKVDGKEFQGEGFRPRYIVDDYVKKNTFFYEELQREFLEGKGAILDSFSEDVRGGIQTLLEDPATRQKYADAINLTFSTLKQSLDNEAVDIEANDGKLKNEMLKNLNEGKPVVCYSVTRATDEGKKDIGLHAWGLVVTKDPKSDQYFLHRCNRGYGYRDKSGILVDKFSEEDMLKFVGRYQNLSNWRLSLEEDSDKFFGELNDQFRGKHIPQKSQEVGNCCYYSFQAIELAVLKEILKPLLGNDSILLAREIKKARTNQMRVKELKNYLDTHQPGSKYPVNWDLLTHIFKKSERKQKLHRYKELVIDYALRAANSENRENLDKFFAHLSNTRDREIKDYQIIQTTTSDEERAKAVADLVKCNSRLLDDLRDFIPFNKDKIASILLHDQPEKVSGYLKQLGYSIEEALTFCLEHQLKHINLSKYGDEVIDEMVLRLCEQNTDLGSINLRNCKHLTDSSTTAILQSSPNLTSCDVRGCSKVTYSLLPSPAKFDLDSIKQQFPSLQIIDTSFWEGVGIEVHDIPPPFENAEIQSFYDKINAHGVEGDRGATLMLLPADFIASMLPRLGVSYNWNLAVTPNVNLVKLMNEQASQPQGKTCWVLISNGILIDSKNKTSQEQLQMVKEMGGEMPDLNTALVLSTAWNMGEHDDIIFDKSSQTRVRNALKDDQIYLCTNNKWLISLNKTNDTMNTLGTAYVERKES